MLNSHLFSGIAQFTDKKPISDEIFVSVQSWTTPFFASSLCHDLFIQTFSQFPYQKFMVFCKKYISWLGSYIEQMSNAMTANAKCTVTWKYVGQKKYLYGLFLWMGFNCLKAKATSRRQFTFYH